MKNKIIKIFFISIIAIFFVIIESCNQRICLALDTPIKKNYLDTLSRHCGFIKYSSDEGIYLMNPVDSDLVCDIDTLFYHKENNLRHIFIFNSSIMERYFIAIIQNEKLTLYPCADLFKICEIHRPNKLVIEVRDSLLQFNSLSYGLHTLELLNKDSIVSYKYTDTVIYDNNY